MKQKGFIVKFFCEGNEPSSKRLVGIGGAFSLYITLIVSSNPSDALIYSIASLSFGALGITGLEKIFTYLQKNKK